MGDSGGLGGLMGASAARRDGKGPTLCRDAEPGRDGSSECRRCGSRRDEFGLGDGVACEVQVKFRMDELGGNLISLMEIPPTVLKPCPILALVLENSNAERVQVNFAAGCWGASQPEPSLDVNLQQPDKGTGPCDSPGVTATATAVGVSRINNNLGSFRRARLVIPRRCGGRRGSFSGRN